MTATATATTTAATTATTTPTTTTTTTAVKPEKLDLAGLHFDCQFQMHTADLSVFQITVFCDLLVALLLFCCCLL